MANPNTKTISVTMWKGQAELLDKAAAKASEKAGRTVSVSAIIRDATIPAACKILGIEEPEFEEFELPHFRRGAISLAAEALGITPEQFKQKQAEIAAEAVLAEVRKATAAAASKGLKSTPVPAAVAPVRRRRRAV